jgi:MerR family copper efflux transcriptional regulator
MRISQLAEQTGVPASTLRFYEDAGLLPADRTPAGYREYGEDALRRLGFIKAGKRLGLSLDEIASVLPLWESGTCAQVKAELRPRVAARLADTSQQSDRMRTFEAFLQAAIAHLDSLPDRTGQCDAACELPADTSERWRSAPISCTLGAGEMPARLAAWHIVLDGAHRAEIPDGIRLTMPVDRAAAVADLAAAEQQCCPFFDFRLHFDTPDLHLEIRAPQAAAELGALFTVQQSHP